MSIETHPCLRTIEGERVPLTGVSATGRLNGLLFELTVEQHYRNTSSHVIETVYTFPTPLHAVLLAFEMELNGTKHVATAFGRQQAERKYENAIDEGDSAALLVDNGNGLYTVNVANLKPGEDAVVRYRYVELLRAHRTQVRLNLPTVIAPRYGNPADAQLQGPAIPGADLLIEYPFTLRVDIADITDAARVTSPSHAITATPNANGLTVTLGNESLLDRDAVLIVDHVELPASTMIAPDGEGFVALASAALPATEADNRPLTLKLLLDCSGSMAGDSIEAAKRALVQMLAGLHDTDRVSLTRFGSDVEHVTEGLEPGDAHSIKPVTRIVQRMNADMGGTNMAEAITATLAIPVPKGAAADLVLITDGEVYNVDDVVALAKRSGHRLFVIAIGAAPNEALARKVSEHTGGACDFVAAGEQVEPAMLRMFGRLRSMPRRIENIDWSTTPEWTAPLPTAVFPNDTIHLLAGFRTRPASPVIVTIIGNEVGNKASNDAHAMLTLPLAAPPVGDVLPRLAAARRLSALPEEAARDLAVKYQLVSAHTSLVLVAQRADADKVQGLPDTIAVPHMLAEGWGGAGQARHRSFDLPSPMFLRLSAELAEGPRRNFCMETAPFVSSPPPPGSDDALDDLAAGKTCDLPDSLRSAILVAVAQALAAGQRLPENVDALHALCPLPEDIRAFFEALCISIGANSSHITASDFIEALLRFLDRDEGRLDDLLPPLGSSQARRFRKIRRQLELLVRIEQAATP
ncbi:MAG: VIT and VWA domain-containing protein [Nevskiaceae bacterium]|jgi:Ca-activated chloride channel family protein|nr:VIT and VWA domain-containing protein [Nevskiaceae bacterium]